MEELRQRNEIQTKNKISHEYINQLVGKKVSDRMHAVLKKFIETNLDYRIINSIMNKLFASNREMKTTATIEEWNTVSHNQKCAFPSEEIEKMFIEEITNEEGLIERSKLADFLDVYMFIPISIKRDKNKSESVYFVMNSNKRGAFQSKEEIIKNLKEDNDKRHLAKLMTLINIKIEERFSNLSKAFRFFDEDGNREITLHEFANSIEKMRIKLSKQDIQLVFNFLDKDGDGFIS